MTEIIKTMNYDDFIKNHEYRIKELYRQKILEHPDCGKISCYIISNGKLNPEQEKANNIIFSEALSELAKELKINLQYELTNDL